MALSTPAFLRGRKGGGSYKNTPDTIRSEDTVEIIMGVGEGRNFGLAEGAKSMLIGGTALVAADGVANFKDFELREFTGIDNPGLVTPMLGGFGSPTQANASSLATGIPVIRTGQLTQIDFLDFRFPIQGLYRTDKKGSYADTLKIKIEFRPSLPAGRPWQLAWSTVPTIPTTPTVVTNNGEVVITRGGRNGGGGDVTNQEAYAPIVTFAKDDVLLRNEANPGPPIGDVPNIWINPTNGQPYKWIDGSWVLQVPFDQNATFYVYEGVVFYKDASRPPANPSIGDVWATPPSGPPVRFNGSSWIQSLAGSPTNYPYTQPMQGGVAGILEVNRKISSLVVVETRVPVERIDVPYDIRITKITGESSNVEGDNQNVSEVGWESFEEILAEGRQFPNTHILQLIARAGDQFTSLPDLEGDVKGRMVNVPTNYDPLTRTYAGVWDGLFKEAWTDNGAWCTRDFIKNERYGLSSIYPYEVNEANFYAWAQWCDEAVVDNLGGSRPRWTYNDTLDQPRPAREQVNYMAGSCGGRLIDDGDGVYDVLIDKPEPISMIFGPESVIDGEFVYSFTDIQTRANWIKVGFVNADLDWGIDFRVVKDPDHIAEFGRIPLEFVATGKTNLSEAMAAARLRLITNTTEFTACTFKTNRVGRFLFPFQTIGICDPDMGWGVSGRISEQTGARQVRLRDAVFLEAGIGYKVTFNRATSPISTVTMTLVPGQTGSRKILNFTTDLPGDIPEFAQFSLESYDAASGEPIALPKAFKILTISPADGDSEAVELTVLELNRFKQAYVEGNGDPIPAEEYSAFNGPVAGVANPRMTPHVTQVGGITTRNLIIEWDRPTNPFARNTVIEYSRDGAEFVEIARSSTEFYELENIASGVHVIRLSHIHNDGIRQSRKVMLLHEVTSEFRTIPPVVDLHLADEPNPPEFESISPMVRWAHGDPDPNFDRYKVTISRLTNPASNPLATNATWSQRITKYVTIPEFIFEFDENVIHLGDAGVPRRAARISVSKVDDYGSESPPRHIVLINHAPQAPTIDVEPVFGGFNVTISPAVERDVIGALIDLDDGLGVVDGTQTSFFIPSPGEEERTIKAAYYDRFSKENLNWSEAEVAAPLPLTGGEDDVVPPSTPTGLSGSSSVTMDARGNPVVRVVYTWVANTEEDLDGYQIEVTEDGSAPLVQMVGTNRFELTGLTGRIYRARIRAVDRARLPSGWTPTVAVTGAADTVAPDAPSSFSVNVSLGSAYFAWTNAPQSDVDAVELWSSTSNTTASATKVTRIAGQRASQAGGTSVAGLPTGSFRYYWLRSVDTSGNLSGFSTAVAVTAPGIGGGDLPSALVATPTGLATFSYVSVNPTTNVPETRLLAEWTANTEAALGGYDVEITETGSSPFVVRIGNNRFERVILPTKGYSIRVRAFDRLGAVSPWSTTSSATGAKDNVAPGVPTSGHLIFSPRTVFARWAAPNDADVAFVEVFYNHENNINTAQLEGRFPAKPGEASGMSKSGLTTGQAVWIWLRAVDTSGNIGPYAFVLSGTVPGIGVTEFASTIRPVELFASDTLAGAATGDRLYFNTTDRRLRRAKNGQWTSEVTGADIVANSITAGQIAAGAISTTELAANAVTAEKIGANQITATHIAVNSLAGDRITAGTLNADRLSVTGALPVGLTVGPGGASIGAIQTWSNDPAQRVNDMTTVIAPGRISVTGGLTLDSWRDSTEIRGGAIKANSITANKLSIGNRQLDVGIIFTTNSPGVNQVSWSAGHIAWTDESNNTQVSAINAGSVNWNGGWTAIWWNRGSNILNTGEVSTPAYNSNDILLAVYRGGTNMAELYGRTTIEGDYIRTGTLNARTIAAGAITADKIVAGEVTMEKLSVTGALPLTLTLGTTGVSIQQAGAWSNDPLTRAGQLGTRLGAGFIELFGGSTLSSWQMGGDMTRINGGAISANTISSNKLSIGNRGVQIAAITFDYTVNGMISWTSGTIVWENDAGGLVGTSINAGSVAWSGGFDYIYWQKGSNDLQRTLTQSVAENQNALCLATYQGGHLLNSTYGRTTIEGGLIKTATLDANRIIANTITGDKIQAGAITTDKLSVKGRGVVFDRFAFTTNGDTLSWINGRANYINGFGTAVQTEIAAGSVYWPPGNDIVVVYWVEGETILRASQYPSIYNAPNTVIVATYYSGGNFTVVNGGQTVIDGPLIRTGAITAQHIAVGSLTADRIAAGTITADKLILGGINYDRLAYGASGRSSIYYHATPFGFGPGSWQAIMGVGLQPQAGSPVVGNFSFIGTSSATTIVAVRVVRNSDQTVVWGHGHNNGCEFEVRPGGDAITGIFFDSTRPNAGRQQYDVQVYSYSQSVACGHRTMTLKELSRDGIDEIQLYVPAYTGVTPGAGSSGGGNINGQTSGDGGTVGTNGNTGWGGGGLAETLQAY